MTEEARLPGWLKLFNPVIVGDIGGLCLGQGPNKGGRQHGGPDRLQGWMPEACRCRETSRRRPLHEQRSRKEDTHA